MKSKQLLAIALLLLASEEPQVVSGVKLDTSNLIASSHRTSMRSRANHRSVQRQKSRSHVHEKDEDQDARETLSSVEIAEVQTDNNLEAEEGDAEQKRQDKAKFDEVMSLMNKYDQAEAHIKWVNSPEYAQKKEDDKMAQIKEKQTEKEKEKELAELEKQRKEEDQKEKQQSLIQQEEDLRHSQEYVKKCVKKYTQAYSPEDGRRILTKDKAYVASGDILSKVRKIRGADQQKFLDNYFTGVWNSHDESHNNLIEEGDVEEFYNDVLSAGSGGDKNKEDEDQ